jgi:hypothetical protein
MACEQMNLQEGGENRAGSQSVVRHREISVRMRKS